MASVGTWLKDFVFGENLTWTFLLIVTQCLFWGEGFPMGAEYGYADYKGQKYDYEINSDASGRLPSGPKGSGVVIITGLLMFSVLFSYVKQNISWMTKEDDEEEED